MLRITRLCTRVSKTPLSPSPFSPPSSITSINCFSYLPTTTQYRTYFLGKKKDEELLKLLKSKEWKNWGELSDELSRATKEANAEKEATLKSRSWKDYFTWGKSQSMVTLVLLFIGVLIWKTIRARYAVNQLEKEGENQKKALTGKLDNAKSEQLIFETKLRTELVALLTQKLGLTTQKQKDQLEREVANIIEVCKPNQVNDNKAQSSEDVFY